MTFSQYSDFWTTNGQLKPRVSPNFFLSLSPEAPLQTVGLVANDPSVHVTESTATTEAKATAGPSPEIDTMIKATEPENRRKSIRFYLAFISICLISFITSMDTVVTAAALPKIAEDLKASTGALFWCGTSFLLTQSVTPPQFGVLSECFGRKTCILIALTIFLVASVICATAPNIFWLIAGRSIQGIGAGGLNTLCSIVVTDLAGIRQRAKYSAGLAISNTCGLVSGVFIGSALAQYASWRIIFYLNIPFCVVAATGVQLFLTLDPINVAIDVLLKEVDWAGITCLMFSTTLLLVGVTTGGTIQPWGSPGTLVPLISGVTGLVLFVCIEKWYAKRPLVPLRILNNRTSALGYLAIFLHGYIVWGISYYLILYFIGSKSHSLTTSAFETLPGTATLAPVAAAAGVWISRTKRFQKLNSLGWLTMAAGLILMSTIQRDSTQILALGSQLWVAFGAGLIFPSRTLCVQAVQSDEDIPLATSFSTFMLALGQTCGVGICGMTFETKWDSLVSTIFTEHPSLPSEFYIDGKHAAKAILLLKTFPPDYRQTYQRITAQSLGTIWMTMAVLAFLGAAASIMMRDVSLDRDSQSRQGFKVQKASEAHGLDGI